MRYRFGEFALSVATRQLFHGEVAVHLSPKALTLLHALVTQAPRVLSREELHETLWPGVHVSDGNLPLLVNEVRQVLHDHPAESRFIRTARGFGYAFVCPVEPLPEPLAGHPGASRVVWASRTFPLKDGANFIGRQAESDVFVEAAGVSRRHAVILVDAEAATVDDLGSKNGTFVDGRRIEAPTALNDGTRIQVGEAALVFRSASSSDRTETVTVRRGHSAS